MGGWPAFQATRGIVRRRCGPPPVWPAGMTTPEPAAADEGEPMSVVALIIWVSAAAGGLPLLAARLIGYASGFQGAAATCLPVSVISATARTTTGGSGSGSVRHGAMA